MEIDVPGIRNLSEITQTNTAERAVEDELGRTAFLELMIAQVSNQNPLEPVENEAFIAQLAQFSSVEGIQNLNESMDSLVASLRSGLAMDAAGLVDRNVLVATNQTGLNNQGGIGGTVEVPVAVGNLTVDITNAAGQRVKQLELGASPQGEVRFTWDGKTENGEPLEQGFYQVSAYSDIDGTQEAFITNLPDRVVSVSIQEGGLVANLAGGTSVPAIQIKEIQ